MLRRIRPRLTYANVVATLALFIALGGSAVAAKHLISGKSIKPHSVPGNRLKNHTITGTQVNLGALGKVPNAANADNLAGSPASDYRLHCPAGLQQAPNTSLCYEPTPGGVAKWAAAMQACALAHRRLPTESELAIVFNSSDAVQQPQLTSDLDTTTQAVTLAEDSSRQLQVGSSDVDVGLSAYRCVTNATN